MNISPGIKRTLNISPGVKRAVLFRARFYILYLGSGEISEDYKHNDNTVRNNSMESWIEEKWKFNHKVDICSTSC